MDKSNLRIPSNQMMAKMYVVESPVKRRSYIFNRTMPKPRAPLRCVNCGVQVFRGVRFECTKLSPRTYSILQQWSPSHDHKESMVCRECYALLQPFESHTEAEGPAGAPARLLGHSKVCCACGRSLLRKPQCYSLETAADDPHVQRVLHEVTVNLPKLFEEQIAEIPKEKTEPQNEQPNESETQTEECTEKKTAESPDLTLSKYSRVRGNRVSCAVAGCREGAEGEAGVPRAPRAPLLVRRRLLRTRRLYLPGAARLCRGHRRPDADLTPLFQRKLSKTFTSEQIADMLFLIKPFPPPLDADNVEAMNQSLRRIWLGVTLEDFLAKKRDNPSISPRALAIRLCAQTSGECPEVLASLFQLPRDEVDKALRATEHLDPDNASATPPAPAPPPDSDKTDAKASETEEQLKD